MTGEGHRRRGVLYFAVLSGKVVAVYGGPLVGGRKGELKTEEDPG